MEMKYFKAVMAKITLDHRVQGMIEMGEIKRGKKRYTGSKETVL